MADPPPDALGRYRLIEVLGSGAMGIVYRAHDPLIDRDVAIKVMRTEQIAPEERGATLQRFLQEVRAAARCAHPAIVAVHDFGGDLVNGSGPSAPYIVMERVTGGSLADLASVPATRARLRPAAILLPVLDALDAVHAVGVVHRDLKPANILMTPDGRPKITDFGIARLRSGAPGLTLAGSVMGTPSYMAPEQARGEAADHRADLFSAGCILYEMLVGRTPFAAAGIAETLLRLASPDPAPLAPLAGSAPQYMAVLGRALAKDPEARFASAAAFAAALRDATEAHASFDETVLQPVVAPVSAPPLDAALLSRYRDALAQYLGPIAATLVRRAAVKDTDAAALCRTLAGYLQRPEERAAFLRHCGDATATFNGLATASGTTARTILPPGVSAAALEAAQAVLTEQIGPIATVIIRRAAAAAAGPDALLDAVAAQVSIEARVMARLRAALAVPGGQRR